MEHNDETTTAGTLGSKIEYGKFLDCVHCGLCTAACPTYLETGDENKSPRGRIYLMRAITDGRLELTEEVRDSLDTCLDCRACETACPSGVQYGRLIEPFRMDMEQRDAATGNDPAQSWFHKYVLHGLLPDRGKTRTALLPARMMQALRLDSAIEAVGLTKLLPGKMQRMFKQLPKLQSNVPALPEHLPAIGATRAKVGLFLGCVADAMFRQTHWATARVLQQNGCEVFVPQNQACCGAMHYHSGAGGPAMELASQNAAAFDLDQLDAVIVNVAGCGAMLKEYPEIAHEVAPEDHRLQETLQPLTAKIKDVSEFLVELGPIAPQGEIRLRATYHDACHLCHAQQIRVQPRDLLKLIPGLELVPLPESEICCGAAGSYNLTEPEMSDRLAKRKYRNIMSTAPQAVITGNAGCLLQIQSEMRHAGKKIPVMHPMDLLDCSYRGVEPPG
mgnify:CR=1 FL=1